MAITSLRFNSTFPLAHLIWQRGNREKNSRMNWRLIDTYLYAQVILQTSLHLETFEASFITDQLNKNTIFILPDGRPTLINSLLPYVGSEHHQSLNALINESEEPNQPITCHCEQILLGKIFYEMVSATDKRDRKIQDDKTKLAKWICQHFKREESGTVKNLSESTILNYLKGKGFSKYR